MTKVKIQEAIEMAKNGKSLKGVVIEDLNDIQVRVTDAFALAKQGVVVPENNIYYDDSDIEYDPEFDDANWSSQPIKMTWEEKIEMFEQLKSKNTSEENVSVSIQIPDERIRKWFSANYDKMGIILGNFIVDIYKANKIIGGTTSSNEANQ